MLYRLLETSAECNSDTIALTQSKYKQLYAVMLVNLLKSL